MTEAHINISSDIINIINNYYNNNIPSLIHIYKHGLCITQNINKTSNMSIYIKKDLLNIFNINEEFSFYNKERISLLSDIKIINNNFIYLNDELNKINFISSCNFCKNIQEIEFTEIQIYNNILQDMDFGWLKQKITNFKGDYIILLSDQINGIVLKINDNDIIIFINVVV